jgi:hypothetical protein
MIDCVIDDALGFVDRANSTTAQAEAPACLHHENHLQYGFPQNSVVEPRFY